MNSQEEKLLRKADIPARWGRIARLSRITKKEKYYFSKLENKRFEDWGKLKTFYSKDLYSVLKEALRLRERSNKLCERGIKSEHSKIEVTITKIENAITFLVWEVFTRRFNIEDYSEKDLDTFAILIEKIDSNSYTY